MLKKVNIAIVILAAGASTRMEGGIKQLLPWRNTTLLGNAIQNGTASTADDVITVLGAHSKMIRDRIKENGFSFIENRNWQSGLGNSIAFGVRHFLDTNNLYDGILIMLADQPLIDVNYLNDMMTAFQDSEKGIVATDYGNRRGVPAIFGTAYFSELCKLNTDYGAKDILKRYNHDVLPIHPDGKEVDVDTVSDYHKLK